MYSIKNVTRLPKPALQSARLLDQARRRISTALAVEELLGHSEVSTTMIYTHVLRIAAGTVASPLDRLAAHA